MAKSYIHELGDRLSNGFTADNLPKHIKEIAPIMYNDGSNNFNSIQGALNGKAESSHTHGNIQNGGTLQTNDITIANGDKLVVTDSSDSSKVARASISFDGSTTTQALTKAGTWATFNNYSHPAGSAPSKTGVPTDNATPGFGGTFKVNQITTDSTSHVSAVTERTITIPNATATTSADGLMSAADKTKLDGIAAGTASPLMDGKASVGNSLKYAREDHVHPSDTSREDIANKTTVVLGTSDSKYPTDKAVAEFVNSSISNSVDQTYSPTSTKAQSGVAVNEAFKTRETSTSDDSYTYIGMKKIYNGTEAVYWKLVSFNTVNNYWTLQFEIDVSNGRKGDASYDTEIYETKRLTICGTKPGIVTYASELRYTAQGVDQNRGYGNNIYYEISSSNLVTVYIKAVAKANETQICRLTSVRNLRGIDNITWYKPVDDAGTQPTNPIKFKGTFPAIASTSSNIGSDSVPVYVNKGKPVSCNSSNLKAGKDDDGNVIKNTYQKKLTFDTTPTAGSSNPVTSDGIKTALNSYVGIYKGDSSNFHVKNNEYYSFICRTNISNWEKIQADFFCPNSDSSTVGKFNIFATLSTEDTSLHTPERVAEFGGIVWDYNYKGYNTIKYRIYVAKSGDNFYFYAKRNSYNDKSITAFRSCLLYTTNPGLTDNVSADLDDATWQTLSLVEMKNVYHSTTQERLDSHKNDTTVHITEAERTAWNAKQSALDFDGTYNSSTNKAATVSSITSRIATAKTELTAAIDSEASARESADTTLQSNIDTVNAKGIVINEINGENIICFE